MTRMTDRFTTMTIFAAPSTSDCTPVKHSLLFTLPLELRQKIYLEVYGGLHAALRRAWQPYDQASNLAISRTNNGNLDLLLTCRMILRECYTVMLQNSVYRMRVPRSPPRSTRCIPSPRPDPAETFTVIQQGILERTQHVEMIIDHLSNFQDRRRRIAYMEKVQTLHIRLCGSRDPWESFLEDHPNYHGMPPAFRAFFLKLEKVIPHVQAIIFSTGYREVKDWSTESAKGCDENMRQVAIFMGGVFKTFDAPLWYKDKIAGDDTKRFILWRKGARKHDLDGFRHMHPTATSKETAGGTSCMCVEVRDVCVELVSSL